jgi:hypothetical protein
MKGTEYNTTAFYQNLYDNSGFLVGGVLLVLAGYFWSAARMRESLSMRWVALIAIALFNARASVQTNFVYAGEAREFIGQVHTTREFQDIVRRIRTEIESSLVSLPGGTGNRPDACPFGDPVWPATWYWHALPEHRFLPDSKERLKCEYVVQDWDEANTLKIPGYSSRRITLRGWWVPDNREMTLKKFLNYSLNHTPWNPPGYAYAALLTKTK